ncbi:MAG: InlB B-repeat-containing protein, partial [Rikenellaceae bacterium]|nr:InlB B-repeat-containing protein [Rikenellaceae bacterium]
VLNEGEVTHVVVSFDLNTSDTSATLPAGEKNYQNIVTATNSYLKAPTPSRSLYNFGGWNSRADGLGAFYTDGQAMNIDKDITLYAIWIAQ